MNTLLSRLPIRLFATLCLFAGFGLSAMANDAILLQGKDKVITARDVQVDAAIRIPLEHRANLLSQPESTGRIALNLYVRRVMADQAKAANLEAEPTVAAALQIARDKVLSDAWLDHIDKQNTIATDVLERLARSTYLAKPEMFKLEEQVRVSHILIADTSEAGRAQAEKILADLKAGADFAKLAKERSADPGTASSGGDLGFFARGTMAKEFQDAAFAMQKPNELSKVVATKYGFHVLKFEGRQPERIRPFEEVKDQLINEARSGAQQRARVEAAQRIEADAKLDKKAISDFAAAQKPKP